MKFLSRLIFKLNLLRHCTNLATERCLCTSTISSESVTDKVDCSVTSARNSVLERRRFNLKKGPELKDFLAGKASPTTLTPILDHPPYLDDSRLQGNGRKVYFDIYGCQMNVNDSDIIWSILKNAGFLKTNDLNEADVVLLVTCSIREGAETKIWNKLQYLKGLSRARFKKIGKPPMKIGILGCMAERLKHKVLEQEQCVDIVAGPDSYRDLPRLLALTDSGHAAVNVLLSFDETYADIMPVRLSNNSVSAFVSIMRGCDNMCTYCIVPFTRGRERSRPISSILEEVRQLSCQGVKEVTLLGQNVNSYCDVSSVNYYGISQDEETHLTKGFRTVYKKKKGGLRFADLLDKVSLIDPEMRIRFTSPHPKDFPDEVLQLIQERPNICQNLHLPAQSGSTAVLERMRRGYTREAYLKLVDHVREILPRVSLSSDFICGFCGETDEEFQETLSLISTVKYNTAFLFAYSMREKTAAHRRYNDDVPTSVKNNRLSDMIALFRNEVYILNQKKLGQLELVLVEGASKRSETHFAGRNEANFKVIFPAADIPGSANSTTLRRIVPGDYVVVLIETASSQVLKGTALYHSSVPGYYADNIPSILEKEQTV